MRPIDDKVSSVLYPRFNRRSRYNPSNTNIPLSQHMIAITRQRGRACNRCPAGLQLDPASSPSPSCPLRSHRLLTQALIPHLHPVIMNYVFFARYLLNEKFVKFLGWLTEFVPKITYFFTSFVPFDLPGSRNHQSQLFGERCNFFVIPSTHFEMSTIQGLRVDGRPIFSSRTF